MELFVETELTCTDSHHDTEDRFGDWYAYYDFEVLLVSLKGEKIDSIAVDFEAKVGDEVYVLWMIYSSGDSFGRSSGDGEVIWVFKDYKIAMEAYKKWYKAEEYSISFVVDGGHTMTTSNPSSGYFEHQDSLHLVKYIVE